MDQVPRLRRVRSSGALCSLPYFSFILTHFLVVFPGTRYSIRPFVPSLIPILAQTIFKV